MVIVSLKKGIIEANTVAEALKDEGLLVKLHSVYKNISEADNYYEIMVYEGELDFAQEIILEKGF